MRAFLHPMKLVTGAAGGRAVGPLKRAVIRWLYTYLARRFAMADWTLMNYGYAPLADEAFASPVPIAAEESYNLNLYWRIATSGRHGMALDGLAVLEIGSGRGGGAAFVAQHLRPAQLVGADIAPSATALAATRYAAIENLQFRTDDAEALALADASFDIVINIESIHCYAQPERFLAEVARVLKPGGELLFAGFAARGHAYDRLIEAFNSSALRIERLDDITANIAAALDADEARKRAFLDKNVRGALKSFALGAYAMQGSPMRTALDAGATAYIAALLTKP